MIKPTDPTTPKKIAIQSVLISEVQAMNTETVDVPKIFSLFLISTGKRSTCLNHLSANRLRM